MATATRAIVVTRRASPRRTFIRHHRGGRRRFRIPLALVAGAIPGLAESHRLWVANAGAPATPTPLFRRLGFAAQPWTGYSIATQRIEWQYFAQGMWPFVVGALVHMVAGRMGINRAFRRIPLIEV